MPYEFYNPSPTGARIGDCVIRAICKALDQTWEYTYVALCVQGFSMYDLPNADSSEARDGRSNRMGRSYDRSYDGRSYDDMSMARNRDSMGRYSRDEFMDKLTMMRESAPNEKSRRAIDKMIDELEN